MKTSPPSNMLSILWAAIITMASIGYQATAMETITRQTSLGLITGLVQREIGVEQFLNIPFAKSPVGDLRFEPPQYTGNVHWNGSRDATRYGPSCYQHISDPSSLPNPTVSEDCLQLNVYVPMTIQDGGLLPVMVWIYGGSYVVGKAQLYDGSYLAARGRVVVVTINYRVNVFGFFSTADHVFPGNMGIKDQKAAFRWVHDNIQDYGGDPGLVTIFGESSGAQSVGIHSLLPSNRGLFRRAIAESGNSLWTAANFDQTGNIARDIATKSNCSDMSSSHAIVTCLRMMTSESLFTIAKNVYQGFISPRIDGKLLRKDPRLLLEEHNSPEFRFFQSVDYMAGMNNAEYGSLYYFSQADMHKYNFNLTEGIPTQLICDKIGPDTTWTYYKNCPIVKQNICHHFHDINTQESLTMQTERVKEYKQSFSIGNSLYPTLRAHAHRNTATRTYFYLFR